MNYKQLMTLLDGDIDLQADTITIYVDGEYFPARIEWHKNDVVDQFVLEVEQTDDWPIDRADD